MQFLEEKLKYYKMKNDLLEKQLLAVQETQQRDVEVECQAAVGGKSNRIKRINIFLNLIS